MLVHMKVDFSKKVIDWDGFGFNYVETAQTTDYRKDPQDYGGFSILPEEKRGEILELVFGDNGLKPNTIKMFLDPFHQEADHCNQPGLGNISQKNYDHQKATAWMRYFVKEGYRISREKGRPYQILTTLYGPPPFMTKQRFMRGRDLDPEYREELAKYITSWILYLRDAEGLPVKYASIHNEGEDYNRWPENGESGNIGTGHDYNLYWTPEAVAEFLPLLKKVLEENGCGEIGVTPGETSNWTRFSHWGYANEIANRPESLKAIGLITSHGFSGGLMAQPGYGDHRSAGADCIRERRPDLHSWVTSTSWSRMDAEFVYQLYENIYCAKNNSIIPWAGIQRPSKWVGGDPNPGNAIQVNEDGSFTIRDGYYYYKQVCPVGQAGMYAAQTYSTDTTCCVMAFAQNHTDSPNAFIVVNTSSEEARCNLSLCSCGDRFEVSRTSPAEHCAPLPAVFPKNGELFYLAPPNSVTTFVEKNA